MFFYDFIIGLLSSTLSKDKRAYKNMKSIIECRFTVIYIFLTIFHVFYDKQFGVLDEGPPCGEFILFCSPLLYYNIYLVGTSSECMLMAFLNLVTDIDKGAGLWLLSFFYSGFLSPPPFTL